MTLPSSGSLLAPLNPASITTKPRSTSGSRNDLFNTSWKPEVPPPRPLEERVDAVAGPSTWSSFPTSSSYTAPSSLSSRPSGGIGGSGGPGDLESPGNTQGSALAHPVRSGSGSAATTSSLSSSSSSSSASSGAGQPSTPTAFVARVPEVVRTPPATKESPKTSSFFDVSVPAYTPPPAPRLSSSLAIAAASSSSSPAHPHLHPSSTAASLAPSPLNLSRASSQRRAPPPALPLHESNSLQHSPSWSPSRSWAPPLPPSADDIRLRLRPEPNYLLGEGRYARVYLAAFRRERERDPRRPGLGRAEEGKGKWALCAAKRLAQDRESQTMGLREAFFLNRLSGAPVQSPSTSGRAPSPSPLRDSHGRSRPPGSVFVVKLIAVKEDCEDTGRTGHGRSVSDARGSIAPGPAGRLIRNRSSTYASGLPDPDTEWSEKNTVERQGVLGSFPSLPALASAAREDEHHGMDHPHATPSLSRLVLVLEHAPLGTLDRLLRTSPGLVGRELWERWAREGAEVLAWVHEKGVVHADVKPGNLLLTTELHLRLSDFGSSLLVDPSHPPTDGLGLGTLPFSPPELIDPARPFSFAVDIFALGATLYQCITGREPYRGSRSVEMMHHVRKGGLWAWEERERLGRIGTPMHGSVAPSPYPSPYPSAWRDEAATATAGASVKRGGSLRVPGHYQRASENLRASIGADLDSTPRAPTLNRMASADSVRASDDAADGPADASPAGVRLWANWVKSNNSSTTSPSSVVSSGLGSPVTRAAGGAGIGMGADAISRLLADDEDEHGYVGVRESVYRRSSGGSHLSSPISPGDLSPTQATHSTHGSSSMAKTTTASTVSEPEAMDEDVGVSDPSARADDGSEPVQTTDATDPATARRAELVALNLPYPDGAPAMLFLDGTERVSDGVREVIKRMVDREPENRPTAKELVRIWDEMKVGIEVV